MAITPDNSRRLLCVLGMHRSGTSLATQLLHRCGAALGPQLLAAMDGVNDDGFWEDSRVVELDERLLAAHGVRWHDCDPLGAADPQALAAIRRDAREHFAAHYSAGNAAAPWLIKDPRQCRLLPFWLPLWREAGFDVCLVHVLRHPFAVAKSLQRRDRIPFEYGVLLWLVYTLDALAAAAASAPAAQHGVATVSHSDGRPGIVGGVPRGMTVAFENFHAEPLALPRALQDCCGVQLPLAQAQWQAAAGAVVKPHLRHHDEALPENTGAHELMAFAASTYAMLVAQVPAVPDATRLAALQVELQALLQRQRGEIAILRRLAGELMALSAESVRVGTLHGEALEALRKKDQLIRDIVYLRFWRVLPLFAHKLMRRKDKR